MLRKFKSTNTALAILFALLFSFTNNAFALVDYTPQISNGIEYLKTQQGTDGSIAGFGGTTSWATMAFVAAGENPAVITNSGESIIAFLQNNRPTDTSSSTEWSREILAIVAAGENPYDFGGLNYVDGLLGHYTNNQIGGEAYLNDDIFGLLALLATGDSVEQSTIQSILAEIIANQETDQGFGWSIGGGSDVDTTAAGIQALYAAQAKGFTHPDLTATLIEALAYLANAQNSDGGFPYTPGDTSNASSSAWAVMALKSANLTGTEYEEAQAFLAASQDVDGSFCWMGCTFGGDTFTSAYVIMALANTSWPIGEFDGEAPIPTATPSPTPTVTGSTTPTAGPTATIQPTEGDVLAGVTQLPETGTGLGIIMFFGVILIIGILTRNLLDN